MLMKPCEVNNHIRNTSLLRRWWWERGQAEEVAEELLRNCLEMHAADAQNGEEQNRDDGTIVTITQ